MLRKNSTPKALVLVHPEPQREDERDAIRHALLSPETSTNGDIFRRIGNYLNNYRSQYQYVVYLPVEHYSDDQEAWDSPTIPAGIKKYQNEIDIINEYDLEDQAIELKRILYLKKIPTVHLGGLSRNCCVRDVAYWLAGRAQDVNFIFPELEKQSLPYHQVLQLAKLALQVKILPALTD